MTRRQFTITGAAAIHLIVVALGASGALRGDEPSAPVQAARWYGSMTGAEAGFGFFAPRVGSEVRVRFTLTDAAGRTWEDELAAGQNQEVRLRVGSMTGLFPADPSLVPFRHDLLASWSATMFGRHPDAVSVDATVEVYEVPSMAEYRDGARPGWMPVYTATFHRDMANFP